MARSQIQKIDTNTPEMDYLLQVYGMGNATHVINKSIELEIFDLLYKEKEAVSAQDLAKKNKFKPDILARLLNCLTALKLVTKTRTDGKVLYLNTKSGDLMAKSNPDTIALMPVWVRLLQKNLDGIADRVKISDPEEQKEKGQDDLDMGTFPTMYEMYQGMHNIMAPQAQQLVTHHDLKGYKSCIDLGGGTGVIAFELRKQYPEMEVTVFEMENVVELAKEKFVPGKEHLGVKYVAGDFFKTPFPNVDLITTSAVLRGFTAKERDELISRCAKALNPGGAFIAFEQMQNEEKDGSASATFWDLSYELLGGGIPSSSEYKALFAKHGFTDITITFTQEWNEVDIIYARKARK